MKLQDFVSETLKQILAGVQTAREGAAETGGVVNPRGGGRQGQRWCGETATPIEEVNFDVAVTTAEGSEATAGAGVFVAGIGLGAKGRTDQSSTSVSRIKFTVPLAMPGGSITPQPTAAAES